MFGSFLDDPRLKASRPISDVALCDSFEEDETKVGEFVFGDESRLQLHPRGKNVLAGTGEADLTGLLTMKRSRAGRRGPDEIVRQDRSPEFSTHHLG